MLIMYKFCTLRLPGFSEFNSSQMLLAKLFLQEQECAGEKTKGEEHLIHIHS